MATANLNPEDLPQEVRALAKGVYFGWAQVRASGMDERVHKMVMNIGNRPTFADSEAVTVVSSAAEILRGELTKFAEVYVYFCVMESLVRDLCYQ